MKNREQLHRFIRKLSKSKKRALNLYLSKYKKTKNENTNNFFDIERILFKYVKE